MYRNQWTDWVFVRLKEGTFSAAKIVRCPDGSEMIVEIDDMGITKGITNEQFAQAWLEQG
jgi:hypothetical protein